MCLYIYILLYPDLMFGGMENEILPCHRIKGFPCSLVYTKHSQIHRHLSFPRPLLSFSLPLLLTPIFLTHPSLFLFPSTPYSYLSQVPFSLSLSLSSFLLSFSHLLLSFSFSFSPSTPYSLSPSVYSY